MNDDGTHTTVSDRLRQVRESIADVRMDATPSDIFARARSRRNRRMLTAAGGACTALGLAVALALPGGQGHPVHVHLSAWSVDTNRNGTVTFTLRKAEQPARLQRVLAEAGVPAMVRSGTICLAQGRHVLLPTQGIVNDVNGQPTRMGSVFLLYGGGKPNRPLDWSWTITPSKIPGSAHFVISAIPGGHLPASQIQAAWEFVPTSAHLRCTPSPGG